MKRKVVIGLVLMLTLTFILSACGGSAPAAQPTPPPGPATVQGNVGETTSFSPGEFQLRIATVVSGDHAWVQMAEFIQEELAVRTDGAVEVLIFPGGQLGNDEATIDDMRLGTLDMIVGGTQNAAPFVPSLQVLGLPYLFEDRYQFESILIGGGSVFDYVQRRYDENSLGLVLLGLSNGGQRNMYSNRPIASVEDLAGLSMRVTASATESLIWATLGALPISMPFNEIYTGMQSGMVDAFEVTLSAFAGSALYEVAPYLIPAGHQFTPAHITFSEISYNRLPGEFRTILREVSEEASRLGTTIANQSDDLLVELMVAEHGLSVVDVDTVGFRTLIEPLYDEINADIGGEELFQIIINQIG